MKYKLPQLSCSELKQEIDLKGPKIVIFALCVLLDDNGERKHEICQI